MPVHSVKAPSLAKTRKGNTNSPTRKACQICLASGAFNYAECVKRARYLEFPRGQRAIIITDSARVASGFAGAATKLHAFGGEPLCRIAALSVGSRRLPGTPLGVAVLSAILSTPHGADAMGNTLRWVLRGSRLLPTDRASNRQKRLPCYGA